MNGMRPMFIQYGLLAVGLAAKQVKHHLNLMWPNWPKQITIYRLCFLFILIGCFSLTMLTLIQLLLTAETTSMVDDNFIWRPKLKNFTFQSLSNNIRQKLLNKMHSSISLKDFLANHNDKIDDHLFSINLFNIDNNNNNNIDDGIGDFTATATVNNKNHFLNNKTKLNGMHENGNDDYWQRVRSSGNKFYIFSAYIDSYNRSNLNHYLELNKINDDENYFIRIIAVTQLANNDKLICIFDNKIVNNNNDDNGDEQFRRQWYRLGRMKPIREHWNLKYSAYFIYCPIPKQLLMINSNWIQLNAPVSLIAIGAVWRSNDIGSLVNNNNNNNNAQYLNKIVPSNRLSIHSYNNDNKQRNIRLAVCVKPLHYYYNKTINLIEFIELNRLFGVERFYFYNHTVDSSVDQLLRIYQLIMPGLIQIMQWQLPIKSQTEIRTEGIFAALNDCLYRARTDGYSYAIFIDLDEFIIPNRHRNLLKLLNDLQPIYRNMVGAYSFRNGFFYLQYPDDVEMEHSLLFDQRWKNMAKQLITLRKTFRRADLNVHKQRSKCIVFTEHTIEMGNHFVWEFSYGKHTLNIDPKIAYLHHYRICEFGGDSCVYKNHPIIDRRTHYWANDLLNAIRKRLESICDRIPMNACNLLTI